MKDNVTPAQMKWGISVIMTLVYAFGAAYFYYLPARGEPNLDVTFWGLLLHFLFLSFLFWLVLFPGVKSGKADDLLMLTVLTVPAGVVASLLFAFAVGGVGMEKTFGLEYLVLSIVPFTLAYKAVFGKMGRTPFFLAFGYWIIAYLWRVLAW